MTAGTRVALVTGASGAIGGELAVQLAAQGFSVILMGRKVARLEQVYDRIIARESPDPALLPLDFEKAHWQNYAEIAEVVESEFGRLDLLVHCAARFSGLQPLGEIDLNDWAKSLQANLTAPFLLTRALLGLLAGDGGATVLTVSDAVAEKPKAFWGPYSIAKAGLANLSGILGEELEHLGIRTITATPAPTATPLRLLAFPAEDAARLNTARQTAEEILALL